MPFETFIEVGPKSGSHLKVCLISMLFVIETFPKGQNLDSTKLKEFADNNFEFDENGRKFSKWVKNTVGKGEIALYEQFLLFPHCFQKTCAEDM